MDYFGKFTGTKDLVDSHLTVCLAYDDVIKNQGQDNSKSHYND